MNSDDVFLQLLGARRSVGDAALAWWLLRANDPYNSPHRIDPRDFSELFGMDRHAQGRARTRLHVDGWIKLRTFPREAVEYQLNEPAITPWLQHGVLHFIPVKGAFSWCELQHSSIAARIALHFNSFHQALLLPLIAKATDVGQRVLVTSARQLRTDLGNAMDHVTVCRALARLAQSGCIDVRSRGQQGIEIALDEDAFSSLMRKAPPSGSSAQQQLPGWSLHRIPVLAQASLAGRSAAVGSDSSCLDAIPRFGMDEPLGGNEC